MEPLAQKVEPSCVHSTSHSGVATAREALQYQRLITYEIFPGKLCTMTSHALLAKLA